MKQIGILLAFAAMGWLMSCEADLSGLSTSDATGADTGVGGSYARFIIVGNFMYVVDQQSLITFDISEAAKPVQVDKQPIGEQIESIFNFKDKLFVGSAAGLFIYQILENGLAELLSSTSYFEFEIFPCDPVVANDRYAYVTLNDRRRVDNTCGGSFLVDVNLLKIFDISDPRQPALLADYNMFAPKGVGLDGTTLFVCDDEAGLKVFDVADPLQINKIAHINNIVAFDVIPLSGLLLVVGSKNVYEYDYTDLSNITLISSFRYGD